MSTTVFISYSSNDKEFVRKLFADLEKLGLQVWLDEKEIKVGQSITGKIADAITNVSHFLIVISDSSVQSEWVKREFNSVMPHVVSGSKTCLPVLIHDVNLPSIIADLKYADFRFSYKEGLIALSEAFSNDVIKACKKLLAKKKHPVRSEEEIKCMWYFGGEVLAEDYRALNRNEKLELIKRYSHENGGSYQDVGFLTDFLDNMLRLEKDPELRSVIKSTILENRRNHDKYTYERPLDM